MITESYTESRKKSVSLFRKIQENPGKYISISGDRPTGALHLGHFFGVLQNRLILQSVGVKSFILIADYQFYTDRKCTNPQEIEQNIQDILLDYLAVGIEPGKNMIIFNHSNIPELNQLMLPFLSLVTVSDLNRNPTVKEEIKFLKDVTGAMLTYPVHQAADILFCKANVVPIGKDQLSHLELARKISRKFNNYYGKTFPLPCGLLSESPIILGVDGKKKMSKSQKNAIYIKSTEEETASLIMSARTDSFPYVSYNPEERPEISNLLLLYCLCTNLDPKVVADSIGEKGAYYLKRMLVDALNDFFLPIRRKRMQLKKDLGYVLEVIQNGNKMAREEAINTLEEVNIKMGLVI
ncbi:MAG: tryptophan--tRNA ligase [Deltaproteobacteria bacterium]|nr:MAG: tryptophan--tRNA ligase [Deltaproteobacteria bacterium]